MGPSGWSRDRDESSHGWWICSRETESGSWWEEELLEDSYICLLPLFITTESEESSCHSVRSHQFSTSLSLFIHPSMSHPLVWSDSFYLCHSSGLWFYLFCLRFFCLSVCLLNYLPLSHSVSHPSLSFCLSFSPPISFPPLSLFLCYFLTRSSFSLWALSLLVSLFLSATPLVFLSLRPNICLT